MAMSDLPECLGATFKCSDPTPKCQNSQGFDFNTLSDITQRYWKQCPGGPLLFRGSGVTGPIPQREATLTNAACEAIAGSGYTPYPKYLIWYRLTTWKFPLFQLIAVSPRPPLGFWREAFAIFHLLGDPIGSFTDLIRKIDSCQDRAEHWKHNLESGVLKPQRHDDDWDDVRYRQRLWKALALIVVSYDEWGSERGDSVQAYLERELTYFCSESALKRERDLFVDNCFETANHLAADRSTKTLPVVIAQAFFIGTIIIAIIRTLSSAEVPNPTTYIDIEAYSIAFSALYFWVISAVNLTSVIGASQTTNAIPNLLLNFRKNLCSAFPERTIQLPGTFDAEERYRCGGLYSWQPEGKPNHFFKNAGTRLYYRVYSPNFALRRRRSSIREGVHKSWPWFCSIIPFLTVSCGTVVGMVLSSLVPPDGWSCRSSGLITIFLIWVVNYALGLLPWKDHRRWRIWFTFIKDFVAMAGTLGMVMATQIGIYNKCSCYTRWGAVGLALPQIPIVKQVLESRLASTYMIITIIGIALQLLFFPGVIMWRYHAAVKVFLQRDDGKSNLRGLYNIFSWAWWKGLWRRLWRWLWRWLWRRTKKQSGGNKLYQGTELGTPGEERDETDESQAASSQVEEARSGYHYEDLEPPDRAYLTQSAVRTRGQFRLRRERRR